jgi:mannitol/fructose-specific phosphotransferase system IIA component (Ntr-type)
VAAVPESLNNEYLRIIGAVSRICGNHSSFERLMGAASAAEFLNILEEGCRR